MPTSRVQSRSGTTWGTRRVSGITWGPRRVSDSHAKHPGLGSANRPVAGIHERARV